MTLSSPHRSSRRWLGVTLLVLITALWGSTFVLVQHAEQQVSPGLINLGRFAIAAIVLSPFLRRDRRLWAAALELSLWLFIGYATQAVGLKYTTANRSAFITSMYVVLVPLLAAAAGKRVRWTVWVAAGLALAGCGLLSSDARGPNVGDVWTLGCAVTWAMYIYRLETHAAAFPELPLAAGQLVGVTLLCLGYTIATDSHELLALASAHIPWAIILYLGLAATAMTTWFQAIGQRIVPASQTAVLFMLEPLWAAVFSWILAGQLLGGRGWIGAGMILGAAFLCSTGNLPVVVVRHDIDRYSGR